MSNRQLVKAAKDILRYVVIRNDYIVPLTLANAAKVIEDCVYENALEDAYNTLQMEEAQRYNIERMRIEMGDVL
tara:strand:- start:280 stop:501 length:222 start_codon:yes stop_codon:yes gene_type:complete